jgi:methylated-DNA-protein-cysteine methyltransferase-like protein
VGTPEAYRRVWSTVQAIPAGRVASYGQIADLAGLPRRARLVGRALKGLPEGGDVPWHRVLLSSGRLAFARGTPGYREQRERLLAEGVLFAGERVDLARFGWSDALDRILWGPPAAGVPATAAPLNAAARSRSPRADRSTRGRQA